ncbi:MAG: hypothetical protein JWQ38_1012 [Flavipsychrobacter sp.]|nr:hypothetical protein [Flavipsychrobacter sp.]
MKKTIVQITAALMIMVTVGMASCVKGPKGDAGPTGTTGTTGTPGAVGDTGATGPGGTNGTNGTNGINGTNGTNGTNGKDGKDGNANVKAGLVTIAGSDWTYNSTAKEYSVGVNFPAITKDVVDNGMVMVFTGDGTIWQAMPLTVYYSSTGSYTYQYQYMLGEVDLFIDISDYSTFTTLVSNTFKIVAVGGAAKKANPNTNWKDYKQVMAVVNNSAL